MKLKIFISVIIVLLIAFLVYPFILNGLARYLIVNDKLEPADLIVVLSGDANGERVDEAVQLYKEGYAPKMLVTGGPLAWNLTAGEWMKLQAVNLGVPAKNVLVENQSRSTYENAKFILKKVRKIGARSIILVTSPTHSRRAKRVFHNMFSGYGVKILSHPVPLEKSEFKLSRWWTRHEDTQPVVWEYVAMVGYLLKGY